MKTGYLRFTASMAVLITTCASGEAAQPPPQLAQQACDELKGKSVEGATIEAAELIPAATGRPEYCRISAVKAPNLNFEVRLPKNWNGKIHYSGGGGYDGSITPVDVAAVGMGYADVSSDSGHRASNLDASFALNDPDASTLFGYLSVPTVMASTQKIVKQRYGAAASESYFEGCSNGGREGLINAQRYPTLFNGVIARAPALNWTAIMGAAHRNAQRVLAPGGAFTPAKVSLLSNAVLAACDSLDGVKEGDLAYLFRRRHTD